jgi:hypothetical protein
MVFLLLNVSALSGIINLDGSIVPNIYLTLKSIMEKMVTKNRLNSFAAMVLGGFRSNVSTPFPDPGMKLYEASVKMNRHQGKAVGNECIRAPAWSINRDHEG